MRTTVAVGRCDVSGGSLQRTGFCRGCGAHMPLVGVVEWSPGIAELMDEVLETGQCAGCGSTVQAMALKRRSGAPGQGDPRSVKANLQDRR